MKGLLGFNRSKTPYSSYIQFYSGFLNFLHSLKYKTETIYILDYIYIYMYCIFCFLEFYYYYYSISCDAVLLCSGSITKDCLDIHCNYIYTVYLCVCHIRPLQHSHMLLCLCMHVNIFIFIALKVIQAFLAIFAS